MPGSDTTAAVDVIGDQTATEAATTSAAAVPESEPVAPYVGAGLGALALALGAGFFWYSPPSPVARARSAHG